MYDIRNKYNGRFEFRKDIDTKYLIIEYLKGKSAMKLAKELHCSDALIRYRLKKNNIKIRGKKDYKYIKGPNLQGKTFGDLLVIKRNKDPRKAKDAHWDCQCKCGTIHVVRAHNLLHNITTRCLNCASPKKGYKEIPHILWKQIWAGAKRRGIVFSITIEYINNLYISQDRKCVLSGLDLIIAKTKNEHLIQRITTASLDRIDSNKGYIENNVQWVHKDINFMKQKFSQEQFIKYCKLVAKAT